MRYLFWTSFIYLTIAYCEAATGWNKAIEILENFMGNGANVASMLGDRHGHGHGHGHRRTTEKFLAGLDNMRPINANTCQSRMPRLSQVSTPAECARTCVVGEKPKTCYYHFTLERYVVQGDACQFCSPNITSSFCENCQCVPGDGVVRMALTANRMIPGPAIEVCKGDLVVIDVRNQIHGAGVSIHWHGIFQKGSQYYDGVPFLTQCPINDYNTFRYQWYADNQGTHFWHAHSALHKMDGLFGSLIVRQPEIYDPNNKLYNYDLSEHVILINDWMHEASTERFPGRSSGPGVMGQHPDAILINGRGRHTFPNGTQTRSHLQVFHVRPNRRYRFRLINAFCTTCSGQITIEGHALQVIETDGQPIQPVVVNSIVSFAGERYDFIIDTNQTIGSYWIQVRGIGPCTANRIQQVAVLHYIGAAEEPISRSPAYTSGVPAGVVLNPLDGICNLPRTDGICVSNLKSTLANEDDVLTEDVDLKVFLPVGFHAYDNRNLYQPSTYKPFMQPQANSSLLSLIDRIAFTFPPSPPLSQPDDIPAGQYCNYTRRPDTCDKNCICTHMLEIPLHALVEIILVDEFQATGISHPFHLHGHAFRVISMGRPFNENIPDPTRNTSDPNAVENQVKRGSINLAYAMELDRKNEMRRCFDSPPAKDTVAVPNNGFAVIRFRANNPGYWLFHCHFIYHQMIGMEMFLRVGEQSDLPPVPRGFPKCGSFVPPIEPQTRRKRNPYSPGYRT
ncbi:hypothetical protein KM043_015558 [Ampulex compressa]|nr:hypothetical protein KM043_015558 [Ampulex compressa]